MNNILAINLWDAKFYNENSQNQYKLGLKLIDKLQFNQNENILDIGCGTGNLTIKMARNNPTCNIIGIDIDKNMIKEAKINLKKMNLENISFNTIDFIKYEPSIKFHLIFSNSAIHWIHDKIAVFQKIKNILTPNGRAGIQIPDTKNLYEITPLLTKPIEELKLYEYFKSWKHPLKRISEKKLTRIIEPIGYSSFKIELMDVPMKFNTFEDLLNYLKSAPLLSIISNIPENFKGKYLDSLLFLLKEKGKSVLNITMKRIFIFLKN